MVSVVESMEGIPRATIKEVHPQEKREEPQKTRPKQVVFTTWSNTNRSNLIPFRLVQDSADLWVSEDLVYLVGGKANELVAKVVDPSLV